MFRNQDHCFSFGYVVLAIVKNSQVAIEKHGSGAQDRSRGGLSITIAPAVSRDKLLHLRVLTCGIYFSLM